MNQRLLAWRTLLVYTRVALCANVNMREILHLFPARAVCYIQHNKHNQPPTHTRGSNLPHFLLLAGSLLFDLVIIASKRWTILILELNTPMEGKDLLSWTTMTFTHFLTN